MRSALSTAVPNLGPHVPKDIIGAIVFNWLRQEKSGQLPNSRCKALQEA